MERRRRNDQVGLRESVARFAALLHQKPPFERYLFGDGEHAIFEHRPHDPREPSVQFRTSACVIEKFDPETDFGKGYGADVEEAKRLRRNKCEYPGLGLRPPNFGYDVGIQQPTDHNSTPRTGNRARSGSRSMSR